MLLKELYNSTIDCYVYVLYIYEKKFTYSFERNTCTLIEFTLWKKFWKWM